MANIAPTVLKPEEVFTPRASSVNPRTYIARPDLEESLKLSLRMPKHIVIHGESGTGKSWLYKKVLHELGYHYEVANVGLCMMAGSIAKVLEQSICKTNITETVTTRELNIGVPIVAQGKLNEQQKTLAYNDPFYSALEAISVRGQGKQVALVFDNLEQVTQNASLSQELAGLLLLVDDERYARHEVKIILVGTPNEVRSLIGSAPFATTIANRLTEIPEVARLTPDQAEELAKTGLLTHLGCDLDQEDVKFSQNIWRLINFHSDRIPQFLQELCLYVAYATQRRDWVLSAESLTDGTKDWVRSSLVKDLARVEPNLNSKATKIGRRNQTIYCLGMCQKYDFNRIDVEGLLEREFPKSAKEVALNVAQILSDLAKSAHPIITRSPKSNYYRFVDPKFRIVVRWLLWKNPETEDIIVRDFDHAISLWAHKKPKTA